MKNTAHNIFEVKALSKEKANLGDYETFNGTTWYSHAGTYLCMTFVSWDKVIVELPNGEREVVGLM